MCALSFLILLSGVKSRLIDTSVCARPYKNHHSGIFDSECHEKQARGPTTHDGQPRPHSMSIERATAKPLFVGFCAEASESELGTMSAE